MATNDQTSTIRVSMESRFTPPPDCCARWTSVDPDYTNSLNLPVTSLLLKDVLNTAETYPCESCVRRCSPPIPTSAIPKGYNEAALSVVYIPAWCPISYEPFQWHTLDGVPTTLCCESGMTPPSMGATEIGADGDTSYVGPTVCFGANISPTLVPSVGIYFSHTQSYEFASSAFTYSSFTYLSSQRAVSNYMKIARAVVVAGINTDSNLLTAKPSSDGMASSQPTQSDPTTSPDDPVGLSSGSAAAVALGAIMGLCTVLGMGALLLRYLHRKHEGLGEDDGNESPDPNLHEIGEDIHPELPGTERFKHVRTELPG